MTRGASIFEAVAQQDYKDNIGLVDPNTNTSVTNLFDVFSLRSGAGEHHADGIEQQSRQTQQLHPRAHQGRCDHVVDKERSLVRQEDAPGAGRRDKISQAANRRETKKLAGCMWRDLLCFKLTAHKKNVVKPQHKKSLNLKIRVIYSATKTFSKSRTEQFQQS